MNQRHYIIYTKSLLTNHITEKKTVLRSFSIAQYQEVLITQNHV